jgi:translation elongation factor EF-Tu-like GTPase
MPIEDVFSIQVVVLLLLVVLRGIVKVGEEIEIVGIKDALKNYLYWC